jgi:hypothetical protein
MTLMDDEKVLERCELVTLTTCRLIEEWNNGLRTIMLDQLCSCSISRVAKPIYLWLAALSLAAGIAYSARLLSDIGWETGVAVGTAFLILYVFTGSKTLQLASAGDSITISMSGGNILRFREFLNTVDAAKNGRYLVRGTSTLTGATASFT